MKRRDFFIKSIGAGIAAGAAASMGGYNKLWASTPSAANYDMVAVMGGEPDAMFDKGISALGGITNFVKKGQRVIVKPNIGWDRRPEVAATTNPILVKRIVEHCIRAGASKVYVFDHTCHNWVKSYKNSGIERAAKDAGATIVPADTEKYYHEVSIPEASILKRAKVHELVLETDVFINVPVLKHHSSTKMTANLKNLMGVVWDRGYWHANNLHQCIADYATYEKKPTLNVIDCYRVMMRNGPQGVSVSDSVTMKAQIISTDILASDVAATSMMNMKPAQVDYLHLASEKGVGRMDLENLNIHRIKM
ncbi:MAG: DUF362 domain-containing protein [Bacteroidota bacterium]